MPVSRHEPNERHDIPNRPSKVSLVALSWMLHRKSKLEESQEIPLVVEPSRSADELVALAEELVEKGIDDEAAVGLLLQLAHGKRRVLRQASATARQDGFWVELENTNRVVRLIDAASGNRQVEPPLPEHSSRFAVLGRFAQLSQDEAFVDLKALVPELGDIEQRIQHAANSAPNDTARYRAAFETMQAEMPRLMSLVGPKATTGGMLERSSVAWYVAWSQLASASREQSDS